MWSTKQVLTALVIVWSFACAAPPLVAANADKIDPKIENLMRGEGLKAWDSNARVANDISILCKQMRATFTTSGEEDAKARSTLTWEFTQNSEKMSRFISATNPTANTTIVDTANNKYRFTVFRLTPSSPYRLRSCSKFLSESDFATYSHSELVYAYPVLGASRVFGVDVRSFFSTENYDLLNLQYVERPDHKGQRLVSLKVRYKGPRTPSQIDGSVYDLILMPQFHWAILEAKSLLPDEAHQYQKSEYRLDQTGSVVPARLDYRYYLNAKGKFVDQRITYEFDRPTPAQEMTERFYLPYYNLPESVLGLTPGEQRNRMLYGVVGLLLVLVAVAIHWMMNRDKQRAQKVEV